MIALSLASIILATFSYGFSWPAGIGMAQIILCWGYLLKQQTPFRVEKIDVAVLFAFFNGLRGLGNQLYFVTQGDPLLHRIYSIYDIHTFGESASAITFLGVLIFLNAWEIYRYHPVILPIFKFQANSSSKVANLLLLSAFLLRVTYHQDFLPGLGTISAFIGYFPIIVIFILSRQANSQRSGYIEGLALALVASETVYALLFGFLRSQMVLPFVAYYLGLLLSRRGLNSLKGWRFVPIILVGIIFVHYFEFFGGVRDKVGSGLQRLEMLAAAEEQYFSDNKSGGIEGLHQVLSRYSTINQVSNIVDLTKKDGFYWGSSLDYLAYAFIPRFIWPNKPIIARGNWFAQRIGHFGIRADGSASNSINMTRVGELYLNFGYSGVFLGTWIFTWLLSQMWKASQLQSGRLYIFGIFFGFYLYNQAIGDFGADMQILVTMTATYLLLLGIDRLFAFLNVADR